MFSDVLTNVLALASTAIAVVLVWAVQSAMGSQEVAVVFLQVLVMSALCSVILFRIHLVAMLRSPKNWRIAPLMTSVWTYVDGEGPSSVEVRDEIELRQIGCLLLGTARSISSTNAPFQAFHYTVTGTVNHEGVVHAEWKGTDRGRNYYGLLLARLSRDGRRLEGKWVGIGTKSIHTGDWIWTARNQ